jgi:hypothetical protein
LGRKEQRNLFCETGATFSPCQQYRYTLHRIWDERKPILVFIMLNPSTATAMINDPTVERCQKRAEMNNFGGLRVVNIFAWRSTDPMVLETLPDPIGPKNDQAIVQACVYAGLIICGWGRHGKLLNRGDAVLKMLKGRGYVPHALKLNSDGSPMHPLYTAYAARPFPL